MGRYMEGSNDKFKVETEPYLNISRCKINYNHDFDDSMLMIILLYST